jgi:hypothetical protein
MRASWTDKRNAYAQVDLLALGRQHRKGGVRRVVSGWWWSEGDGDGVGLI